MQDYLRKIAAGETLLREEAEDAMRLMMRGEATTEAMAGFLVGLAARGETLDEMIGFTAAMREHAVDVDAADADAVDLCGTGGDGSGTFNISTAAAFVVAGAGVTVAKHGNRSVSSKCGSADVLEALGVQTDLGKEGVEHCFREAGMAFLFAPRFHPALRHVMPVRRALGVRTCFNILGPLANPAGVRRQLVGAYRPDVAQTMARILAALDAERIVAVHGSDGLDELSLSAPSTVIVYDRTTSLAGEPHVKTVEPEHLGLGRVPAGALQGGDAKQNAAIIRNILDGNGGPHRDVVLLNAAYALYASGRHDEIEDALSAADRSLTSGTARERLDALVESSHHAAALA